jgi:hypothetical protein
MGVKTKERIEVTMTNERERSGYYGALSYSSKNLLLKDMQQLILKILWTFLYYNPYVRTEKLV